MRTPVRAYCSVLLLFLVGCDVRSSPPSERNQLTQVSIINALMLGEYDGVMTMQELLRYGNLGLGTVDHLDGEMVILDGRAYQAKSDGTVVELALQTTTPFAMLTQFDKQGQTSCNEISGLEELEGRLDRAFVNDDLFYAIRLDADFDSITIRSVPRQEPPYAALAEVAKRQVVWTHEKVQGTLVGFRSPEWAHGLSVPGYHWHFLSADHKLAGHVLNCHIRSGTASYARCDSWLIKINESLGAHSELNVDLSGELEQVEHLR